MPERPWARVKELFEAALAREGAGRDAYLAEACGDDVALRGEVLSLLEAHAAAEGFLERPPGLAVPALEGRLLGPYRLVDEVGRGGMGTVYRAVRDDDAFRKVVAVKVVRPEVASAALAGRFRAERQILARLDHPNIARLFDGGTTEEGEPYLVMEYVEGRPIDVFCAELALSTASRLRLFRTVCGAVHYAHQNLVVHRDLKPGNILVTGEGLPKLLDFGIAKLLAGDATDAPTRTAFPALTPDYASPEQVRAEPVTTASDVYSLGIVLYELLTGRRPYHVATPVPEEIVRLVCEVEPEKPSTAVRRAAADPDAPTLPAPPATDPRRRHLAGELVGDLDTIVLKALRKEPARRYASAQELADDLQRYLDGRPVLARPDTLGYRAAKFVRRHRAATLTAAVVLLSLLGGIVATAWQARIAEAHRRVAEKRFSEVRTLARSFLFEIHDAIRDLEGSTQARATIVKRALEYLDRLAAEAGDDRTLLAELAAGYDRVATVQGDPGNANLGDLEGALASWNKGIAIRERLHAAAPADLDITLALAGMRCRLARGLLFAGRGAQAVSAAREARAVLAGIAAEGRSSEQLRRLAAAWASVGDVLRLGGETRDTLGVLEQGLALAERARSAAPDSPDAVDTLASVAISVSDAYLHVGRREDALATLRRASALAGPRVARAPGDATARYTLLVLHERTADLQGDLGDFAGSLETRALALALVEEMAAADPHDARVRFARFVCHYKHGVAETLLGRYQAAVRSQDRALDLAKDVVAAEPGHAWARHLMSGAHAERGEALERAGALGAAAESYARAEAMDAALVAEDPQNAEYKESLADVKTRLARTLTAARRPEEALRLLAEALRLLEPLAAAEPDNTTRRASLARIRAGEGHALRARGQGAAADRAACAAFAQSAAEFLAHEARAPLSATDRAEKAAVARALLGGRCRSS